MPEITAEQLAARIGANRMGEFSYSPILPMSYWDHIIACLREHESRAATRWVISTECLLDDNGKEIACAANDGSWAIYGELGSLMSERSALGAEERDTLDAAKAAVEKAVRNG